MRRKWAYLIAVIAAATLAGFLFANRPTGDRAPTRPDEPGTDGPEVVTPPDRLPETPDESEGTGAKSEVPAEAEVRYRLIGTLLDFDPALPGETHLAVRPVSTGGGPLEAPVVGRLIAGGRFDLDVARFLTGDNVPDELDVRVDHPAYLPVRHRVRVEPEPEIRVEIPMHLAAVLTGRVVDASGSVVPGATVSVHDLGSADLVAEPTDITTTGGDGTYRIRVKPGREDRLLVACSSERAPEARVVTGVGGPTDDLVLPDGAAITGQVVAHGEPVAGAKVRLGPWPEDGMLAVKDQVLAWDGSRVRRAVCGTVTAEDGTYRLAGLDAMDYEVTVRDVPGLEMHSGFSELLTRTVRPAAAGVDFDVTGVRLVVHVEAEGESLGRFGVMVYGGGGYSSNWFPRKEAAVLLVAPGEVHKLHILRTGYRNRELTVEATAAGGRIEMTVPLEPEPPSPTLVVELRVDPDAPALTRAGFGFYHSGAERGPIPSCYRNCTSTDGETRFRMEDLPVGPFVVVARPGTKWDETRGHFLFAEAEVTFFPGREARLTLDAKLGGRLRIAARDAGGTFLSADCTVLTANGRKVPTGYIAQDQSGLTFGDGGLVGDVPNEVNPPLEPGTYRIELEVEGYHPKSVPAEVKKGMTTEVNVVLEKR